MVKITLKIDGMACGMCEAHVNDAIRQAFSVKKVKASHSRGQAEIIAEGPLEEAALKAAVAAAGYAVTAVCTEPYEKKAFGLFGKR